MVGRTRVKRQGAPFQVLAHLEHDVLPLATLKAILADAGCTARAAEILGTMEKNRWVETVVRLTPEGARVLNAARQR